MGLDITVYKTITPLDNHTCDLAHDEDGSLWDECYEAGHRQVFVYEGFEQSYRGLPVPEEPIREVGGGGGYPATRLYGNAWVVAQDGWGFRAGSYSGYGMFRETLRNSVWGDALELDTLDVDKARDLPFFELIFFADNEGTIGPEACADLARDFDEHKDAVESRNVGDDYFIDRFREWGRAFHDAANTGMIDFH